MSYIKTAFFVFFLVLSSQAHTQDAAQEPEAQNNEPDTVVAKTYSGMKLNVTGDAVVFVVDQSPSMLFRGLLFSPACTKENVFSLFSRCNGNGSFFPLSL